MILRRISGLVEPLRSLNNQWAPFATIFEVRKLCTTPANWQEVEEPVEPKKHLSKAMKAYLERAQDHNEFMAQQQVEYHIGKRHLANMMGEDPETFTQEDVDNAIEYLFPSGLYEKKARPFMKPPEEVYPKRKAAEFDETGRPYHFLFYTGKPNFFQVLHDVVTNINSLYTFEEAMFRKGVKPDPNLELDFFGYQWISKEDIEKKLVETLSDRDYGNFINAMERLCSLPYSYRFKDFIMQYKKPLMSQLQNFEAPKLHYDADGRAYITTYECRRKTAIGDVTIRAPGTGKISINGKDITYFEDIQSREQFLLSAQR